MKQRSDYIHAEIKGWLTINGKNGSWLARSVGKTYSSVFDVVSGRTKDSPEIKNKIVEAIGFDPWEHFPEVEYVPPCKAANE